MRSRWVGTATREPFLPRNGGTDGFLKALHPTQPPERSCGSLVRAVRALFNPCSRNAVCWSAVPPATGGMCCSDHRATLRPCKPRSCQSRRSIRQLARVACLNESRGKLAPHDSPPPTPRSTAKGSLGPPNSGDRSARPGHGGRCLRAVEQFQKRAHPKVRVQPFGRHVKHALHDGLSSSGTPNREGHRFALPVGLTR